MYMGSPVRMENNFASTLTPQLIGACNSFGRRLAAARTR